jgi:hypothetical protein
VDQLDQQVPSVSLVLLVHQGVLVSLAPAAKVEYLAQGVQQDLQDQLGQLALLDYQEHLDLVVYQV